MCQCPQRASTYFFRWISKIPCRCRDVSMPSTGFYLFLPCNGKSRGRCKTVCQCPQRASTYFFEKAPFLEKHMWKLCQCPQRASTYFFPCDRETIRWKIKCVNALNGLLLISSFQKLTRWTQRNSVNALNGLLLISSIRHELYGHLIMCVNALNGLLLISSYN